LFYKRPVYTEDIFEKRIAGGCCAIRAAIESFERARISGHQHHAGHIVMKGICRANAKAFCFVTLAALAAVPIRMTGITPIGFYKRRWLFKERLAAIGQVRCLKGFPGQSGKKVPRKRPTDVDSPAPSGQKS